MFLYLIKRIVYFIPTLLMISMIVFFLSKCAGEELQCVHDIIPDEENCRKEAALKGYDKPVFYFTLTTSAHPDTLHHVFREERRIVLNKLIGQYGNWEEIEAYYHQLIGLENTINKASFQQKSDALISMRKLVTDILVRYQSTEIEARLKRLAETAQHPTTIALLPMVANLQQQYQTIQQTASKSKLFIPKLQWHGKDNQYHRWFSNFLVGDLGKSSRDSSLVSEKIMTRLPWTLALTLPAIFLAFLLSIPLGVYTAVNKNSSFDKRTSFFLLLLFSLPLFWIATLCLNFFTTPEYGMKIFPSISIRSLSPEEPLFQQLWANATKLILPILCLTYGSLAFITRQLRGSMIETLQQDFIKTARAKGLNENQVIWKHAFKNSLFPLITLFANVLPAAFAGSVVIEFIFNIQGMGLLMLDSIGNRDWQVVYSVLMIAALLTILGILLADILYALVDPRVRFGKQ